MGPPHGAVFVSAGATCQMVSPVPAYLDARAALPVLPGEFPGALLVEAMAYGSLRERLHPVADQAEALPTSFVEASFEP